MKTVSVELKRYWIIEISKCKFWAVAFKDLIEALDNNPNTSHYDSLLYTLKHDFEITYPELLTLVKQ